MQKRALIFLFAIIILAALVSAHQPRLVTQAMTGVKNPEISQAFYGELKGNPAFFQIQSRTDFKLYVGILVPDLPNAKNDLSVQIILANSTSILLNGTNFNWTPFYEEFANDNYYWGPELRLNATKGIYTIKVFSPTNIGKYSLAIGETESFPLNEILNTIVVLPKIKMQIFNKPWYSAFTNKIGQFLFVPVVAILLLVLLAYFVVRRFSKLKSKSRKHL